MKRTINSSLSVFGLFLGLALLSLTASAQENEVYRIYDASNSQARTTIASSRVPNDLLHGSRSTIYVKNNSVLNQTGVTDAEVLKLEDVQSYNFINQRNPLFKDVQVITITLKNRNELFNAFDASAIRGFNHLHYIYIKCNFDCSEQEIRSFVQNADPEITIFYKVAVPH